MHDTIKEHSVILRCYIFFTQPKFCFTTAMSGLKDDADISTGGASQSGAVSGNTSLTSSAKFVFLKKIYASAAT